VRELMVEVRSAALVAAGAESAMVKGKHLAHSAGALLAQAEAGAPASAAPDSGAARVEYTREQLVEALEREGGNVARTARVLGLHRTQLRRLLTRHNIDFGRSSDGD
jgi:transcriptional regulator with GAF, ATPase, and Fis domain